MKAFLMSAVLILFVIMLIYIVKNLIRCAKKGEHSIGVIVIPIHNDMVRLAHEVKKVYWDEAFKEERAKEILLLPVETLDVRMRGIVSNLEKSFSLVRLVSLEEFENTVQVLNNFKDNYNE